MTSRWATAPSAGSPCDAGRRPPDSSLFFEAKGTLLGWLKGNPKENRASAIFGQKTTNTQIAVRQSKTAYAKVVIPSKSREQNTCLSALNGNLV